MKVSHNIPINKWLVLLAVLSGMFSMLQAQPLPALLEDYMQQLRSGQYPPAPAALWQDRQNQEAILLRVIGYHADTIPALRAKAYNITRRIGLGSQNTAVRQQAVLALMAACRDSDAGNSGLASSYLTAFAPADFNDSALDSLRSLILQPAYHYHRLLRLTGYLQLHDLQTTIRQQLASGKLRPREAWSAYLALARMGDKDALLFCLQQVKAHAVGDDVVYELLPELLYTRQPEAIRYLVSLLYEEQPACTSADMEEPVPQLCAYRIMEMLAPVIAGFPVEADASGDLMTEDYQLALQQVRQWFDSKQGNYRIISHTY